ncbi:MAG: efflux RND transporter periplasmic adaptor subunit [Bacteroidetes bacterium]|nr:efflux RND transporter periplasmic adaptor subunit [Bacteroidota bacterium]
MTKKLWIWFAVGGIILLIAGIWIANSGDKSVKVATDKVVKRTITEIVSVSGKIQPETEVKISADVSGEIVEMAVKEGDSVRQGQLLLRINPELYETTLSQLSANLDNSRASLAGSEAQRARSYANLMQAESNYNRQKSLFDQHVISQQEWDQARMQYEVAKADLTAADKNILAGRYSVQSVAARLEEGRRNLGRTSIYAPAPGIVTQLSSEKGERVVGTAQMAGTEIMRISNLNVMEVEVNVNENDIVRIQSGDSADIKVDAYPDRVFRGVVTQIANSAKFASATNITDQVTTFVVKVRIIPSSYSDLGQGKNQPFRPGMTATVDIRTESRRNVLSIPISSVTTRNLAKAINRKNPKSGAAAEKDDAKKEENTTWVFLLENGRAKAVKVRTGIQDIDYFEVTEGVKEGDEVISAPGMAVAKTLLDGEKVQKVPKEQVFGK